MTTSFAHRSAGHGTDEFRVPADSSGRRRLPKWLNIPLFCILLLQLGAMLTLRNSPFQDEALYMYVGNRLLDAVLNGDPTGEPFSGYLSGLPYLYPVMAGLLDHVGGPELARMLSSAAVLFTTFAAYRLGSSLFGSRPGLLAAASVACQTSFLFVGRLATYDALALALMAAAAVVAVETTHRVGMRTWIVAFLCASAVVAKYAAAAVVPAVIVLLFLAPGIRRGAGVTFRIIAHGAAATGMICAGLWALTAVDPYLLDGLTVTTTSRDISRVSSIRDVLAAVVASAGATILLAAIGWATLAQWGLRRRTFALASTLLLVALVIPAYHLAQGELTSLDKHLAFTGFLLSPLAGLALHRFASIGRSATGWIATAAILVVMFATAVVGAQQLFMSWPETSKLKDTLLQLVRLDETRVLAEEVEVPKYYLVSEHARYWQFTGLDFIEYADDSGDILTGRDGYVEAIQDGYYGVIAFRYGPSAELAVDLTEDVERSGRYERVAILPYSTTTGEGNYNVWRRIDDASEEQK